MVTLMNSLVPSSTYNALPLISEVATAPQIRAKDLLDLRQLLHKHDVPKGVSIRLIHKHFDTTDGEVMVFEKINVPEHGFAKIMKPVTPPQNSQLQGIHFFVNGGTSLQAYEYGACEVPDMKGFETFLVEFCQLVSERGLRRIFGLKLQCEDEEDHKGWTEYELHSKRGTIMFPEDMPMPESDKDYSVTTEWPGILTQLPRTCRHQTICTHGPRNCRHTKQCKSHLNRFDAAESNKSGFCVGGQEVLPGTMVHGIIERIAAAF